MAAEAEPGGATGIIIRAMTSAAADLIDPPRAAPTRHRRPQGGRDEAFDRWLRAELLRLHGDALREPIPESLLRLIADAARKDDGSRR